MPSRLPSLLHRIVHAAPDPNCYRRWPRALCASLLACILPAHAADPIDHLFDLDLSQLVEVKVVSVTKQEQKLSESAAAIHVISADDIRRAGVSSLPEALRLAPGLMVHRISSNQWAVSARGFPSRFTRKLLTLINGRSIYDPTFAGTFWPMQDLPIEEIDRIEVILGPGATLWGANAVNGIINILTKDARDTHGNRAAVAVGTEEHLTLYGGHSGNAAHGDGATTHYRVFGSHKRYDGLVDTNGNDTHDDWHTQRVGLRTDTDLAEGQDLFVSADAMRMVANEVINVPDVTAGPTFFTPEQPRKISNTYHLLARWNESSEDGEHRSLQAYYDYSDFVSVVATKSMTLDLEYQHGFRWLEDHHLIWGVGARSIRNTIDGGSISFWDNATDTLELFSGFVQDEIRFLDDDLRITLGSKVEKSEYTGVEFQPNARLAWLGLDNHVFWGAVSRALRTPSRANRDLDRLSVRAQAGPALLELRGDEAVREVESEELTAWELGYRFSNQSDFTLDLALFYNDYSNLNSQELGALEARATPIPHAVQPLLRDNNLEGTAVGGELSVNWQVLPWWRLRADYSHFHATLELEKPSATPLSVAASDIRRQSPRHRASLRSQMDFDNDVELDFWVRHVDNIPAQDLNAYVNLDARIGWKLAPDICFALVGRNLLDDQQSEIRQTFITGPQADVERSVQLQVDWSF